MSEQEALELELLIDRRDSFAAAFEHWKSQIGGPDEAALSNDAGNPIMAMLLCADMWRQLTRAVDRRLGMLTGQDQRTAIPLPTKFLENRRDYFAGEYKPDCRQDRTL